MWPTLLLRSNLDWKLLKFKLLEDAFTQVAAFKIEWYFRKRFFLKKFLQILYKKC